MSVSGPNVGFGAAITFQTGFCAFITNIDVDGIERTVIDTSNDATSTPFFRSKIPGKLIEPGAATVELLLDPAADWKTAMTSAAESITVTFPKFSTQTVATTWASSGFMSSFKAGVPMDDKMTATAVLQFTSTPTITSGA